MTRNTVVKRPVRTRAFSISSLLGVALAIPATAAGASVHTASANLVRNGGFVTPAGGASRSSAAQGKGLFTDFCARNGLNPDCPSPVPVFGGWRVTTGSVDLLASVYINAPTVGVQSVDLDGAGPGGISQTLVTKTGKKYVGSFMLAGNPDGTSGASANPIKHAFVTINGRVIARFSFNVAGRTSTDMGYVQKHFTFTATSKSSALGFKSGDKTGSANGAVISDVTVLLAPG